MGELDGAEETAGSFRRIGSYPDVGRDHLLIIIISEYNSITSYVLSLHRRGK